MDPLLYFNNGDIVFGAESLSLPIGNPAVGQSALPQTSASSLSSSSASSTSDAAVVRLLHKPRGSQGNWEAVNDGERIRVTKDRGKWFRLELVLPPGVPYSSVKLRLLQAGRPLPEDSSPAFAIESTTPGPIIRLDLKLFEITRALQFAVFLGEVMLGRSVEFTSHNSGLKKKKGGDGPVPASEKVVEEVTISPFAYRQTPSTPGGGAPQGAGVSSGMFGTAVSRPATASQQHQMQQMQYQPPQYQSQPPQQQRLPFQQFPQHQQHQQQQQQPRQQQQPQPSSHRPASPPLPKFEQVQQQVPSSMLPNHLPRDEDLDAVRRLQSVPSAGLTHPLDAPHSAPHYRPPSRSVQAESFPPSSAGAIPQLRRVPSGQHVMEDIDASEGFSTSFLNALDAMDTAASVPPPFEPLDLEDAIPLASRSDSGRNLFRMQTEWEAGGATSSATLAGSSADGSRRISRGNSGVFDVSADESMDTTSKSDSGRHLYRLAPAQLDDDSGQQWRGDPGRQSGVRPPSGPDDYTAGTSKTDKSSWRDLYGAAGPPLVDEEPQSKTDSGRHLYRIASSAGHTRTASGETILPSRPDEDVDGYLNPELYLPDGEDINLSALSPQQPWSPADHSSSSGQSPPMAQHKLIHVHSSESAPSPGSSSSPQSSDAWSSSPSSSAPDDPVTHIDGSLVVHGVLRAKAFFQFSDIRLKTDIADIVDALDLVTQLQGKTYHWRSDKPTEGSGAKRAIGFIAQEVQKVVPELVRVDAASGLLAVSYAELLPLLIEAFKQMLAERRTDHASLQSQLDELRATVNECAQLLREEGSSLRTRSELRKLTIRSRGFLTRSMRHGLEAARIADAPTARPSPRKGKLVASDPDADTPSDSWSKASSSPTLSDSASPGRVDSRDSFGRDPVQFGDFLDKRVFNSDPDVRVVSSRRYGPGPAVRITLWAFFSAFFACLLAAVVLFVQLLPRTDIDTILTSKINGRPLGETAPIDVSEFTGVFVLLCIAISGIAVVVFMCHRVRARVQPIDRSESVSGAYSIPMQNLSRPVDPSG